MTNSIILNLTLFITMPIFTPTIALRNAVTRARVELIAAYPENKAFKLLRVRAGDMDTSDFCRLMKFLLDEKDKEEYANSQVLFCSLVSIGLEFADAYKNISSERLRNILVLRIKEFRNKIDEVVFFKMVGLKVDDVLRN